MTREHIAQEWQFDGLVGPTHNYAGLAQGNLAAQYNAGAISNPRAAALQGLEKMRFVRDLGIPQAFLPPHFRPLIPALKRLGFTGSRGEILKKAAEHAPALLASVYSSSFMWAANAATVTPSCDSTDRKLHITPANMASHFHRAIETDFTFGVLQRIFHNKELFSLHKGLFPCATFGDEGAANHMVNNYNHGLLGKHFFVYGNNQKSGENKSIYQARQHCLASEAIARLHKLKMENCIYLEQSQAAIDQGVFHNDVIAMNTTRRMIVHEEAFVVNDRERIRAFAKHASGLCYREITRAELSVAEAVSTYFFNSQLLNIEQDRFVVLAPSESEAHPKAHALFEQLKVEGLIDAVHYFDLRESMRNGGGPACLRLRIAMTPQEAAAIHPGIILTDARYEALKQWVNTHYRDRVSAKDFCDPEWAKELESAYLALEAICELPGLYQPYMD